MKISLFPIATLTVAIAATLSLFSVASAQAAYGTPEYWTQQQADYSHQLQQEQYARQQAYAQQQSQQQQMDYQQQQARQRVDQQNSYYQQERDRATRDQNQRYADQQQQSYNQQQRDRMMRDQNQRDSDQQRQQQMNVFVYQQSRQQRPAYNLTAALSKGYTNGKAWGIKTVFRPVDHTINVPINFDGVAQGSIQVVWVAVNVKDFKGNIRTNIKKNYINERVGEARPGTPTISTNAWIFLDKDWPRGSYRAEIYYNGHLVKKLPYKVV